MRQLDKGPIPSPFTARWQAPAFVGLMLVLLLLPVLSHYAKWDHTENRYLELDPYYREVHGQIYEEQGDLDLLILGTCHFRSGIDVPTIRDALSKQLGRPARVKMFATLFAGEDLDYAMLRDFLRTRKVRALALQLPGGKGYPDGASILGIRWLRFQDVRELAGGVPLRNVVELYTEAVLGAPRHLLGFLRPESQEWGEFVGTDGMEHNLFCEDHTRFHPLAIDSRKLAARDWSYRPASPKFEFTQEGLPPFRKRAFERIIQLAREHRIPVINIQMPNKRALAGATVKADAYWPDYFGYPIEMIGIPPSDYFQGLDEKQIHCLFWEIDHPNRNGALYFTKSIAPTLVKAYGRSAQTH